MLIGMHALTITVHKSDVVYMLVRVTSVANPIAMMNFESDKWNVLVRFKLSEQNMLEIVLLQANCIGGCPCQNYPCIETTTTTTTSTTTTTMTTTSTTTSTTTTTTTTTTTPPPVPAILVLSTYSGSNVPMVIGLNGNDYIITDLCD